MPETLPRLRFVKAHAYGNSFLLIPASERWGDAAAVTRRLCDVHEGIGADGVIFYESRAEATSMTLRNADGSPSELSGNGLRCLAALIARSNAIAVGGTVVVDTSAGRKTLELLGANGSRLSFRTALGPPTDVRQVSIDACGERLQATVLGIGNPQCVVLGPLPDADRFHRLGPALATHTMFPAGTNVEFAEIEGPESVRILIWERGVGPTTSSGTGTAASAVAAIVHGGARRSLQVIAPGGTQRVEWREDGVHLTGWAEVSVEGEWIADLP